MKQALLVFPILLASFACTTAPKDMADHELTNEVYNLSGLEESINSMPQAIVQSLSQKKAENTEDQRIYDNIENSMVSSFQPEKLRRPIFNALEKNLTRAEKIDVVNWYRSSTGEMIAKIEDYTQSPQGQAHFQQWLQELERKGTQLNEKQLSFASEVARETGALNLAVESITAVSTGMIIGANSVMPEKNRLSKLDIEKQTKMIKNKMYDALAPSVILTIHFAYGALPQERKDELLGFLKSKSGSKFMEVVVNSFSKSFDLAARRTGKHLMKSLAH